MKTTHLILCAAAAGFLLPSAAAGPIAIIITDRANDALWVLEDLNNNGIIDEPDEVRLFFGAGNAAGIPTVDNPNTIAVRSDGLVAVGDQIHRNVYLLQDHNRSGDAMGALEARVAVDINNAAGHSFAFPTGAAFDDQGVLYISNAGNSFGPDIIYRLVDLNGDGTFMGPGEVQPYVAEGAFGPGNGPWVPYEIFFDHSTSPVVGYLRNTGAGLHGVYRFVDLDGNGRADDPGEFTTFFDASNASGLSVASGFALEPDRFRPAVPGGPGISMYFIQTLPSPTRRQIIRLTDLNNDNTAQGPGEAVVVYETQESGFTPIDLISLPDGRVLLSDNSGKKVWVFEDLNGDGTFMGPGERREFFSNTMGIVGDIRAMDVMPTFCRANCDNSTAAPVLTIDDFLCFIDRFSQSDPYADCDGNGMLNIDDFLCFIDAFAQGC